MEYKRCSSYIPGLGALTGYYQPGQLNPATPNMEYRHCSSCFPGLEALTGYYQLGQLSPGFFSELVTAPLPPFSSGLGTGKGGVREFVLTEWEEAGLPMTTTSNEACKLYDAALSQYVGWYELEELAGLETTVEAMINTEPTFVMGHVVNVGLDLLSTGKSLLANPQLSDNLSLLNSLCKQQKITSREHMHVQALRHFADGHFLRAAELWETILIDHPSDMLAIKFAHDTYFYTGEQMQVRDSIARVLPYWNPTMPHYGYLHGMHAFGLVETNLFRQAELAAKKGLQFNAYDGWSTHALAHVYEMEGRTDEGILFLLNTEKKWERCGLLACHNYWHWAIYHMEDGNYKTAMELYEDRIQQYLKDKSILNIVDCASLLFRLKIADWPVRSELWRDVYNVVEPHLEDHITTFNDIHFLMTCLGADEMASAANLQETYINME
ncbi:TTC38 [Cordylochernes scorpioides]|uniref:Tetratricopeptide repeat protein 38 n=1 Tax=Cordylochernes scorpioides TaxID=51811 RepID=A0ABY6LL84_9ARAC|nr:TTC38 [Cordylochernes scorpioides]